MRKISVKIGVTAAFALGLASFAGAITTNDAWAAKPEKETVKDSVVDCTKGQSIQAAVNAAVDGDTVTVFGRCTEIVTITTDGITVIGGSGTLFGGFIVDGAQRVVIDDLTIDGSTTAGRLDGVRAQNNAHVTVRNCTILNHTRSGANITRASSGLLEGNTITVFEADGADSGVVVSLGSFALLRGTAENPTQSITSNLASGSFGNSLGVFHDSHVRLNGGNTIVGSGNAPAIGVFNDARAHPV